MIIKINLHTSLNGFLLPVCVFCLNVTGRGENTLRVVVGDLSFEVNL